MSKNFGPSVTDVVDRLFDSGLDINKPIEDLADDPTWKAHKPTGLAEQSLYVHQVPKDIEQQMLAPELWHETSLYLGPSAIGKTQAIEAGLKAAAEKVGRKLVLSVQHLSQVGPYDMLGVPRERPGTTGAGRQYWCLPEIFPVADEMVEHDYAVKAFLKHLEDTGEEKWEDLKPFPQYALFLDEFTNPSTPQTPHQVFPLILDRHIGYRAMVKDYVVIAAGNRAIDNTNSQDLAFSAVTRMALKEVVPFLPGWLKEFATVKVKVRGEERWQIHPTVVAFLFQFKEHYAPSNRDTPPMQPIPTPRSWQFVSDRLYLYDKIGGDYNLLQANVAGRIGSEVSQLFFEFLAHYKDIPNADDVLAGKPVKWPDQTRLDLYTLLGAHMVSRLNESNGRKFMEIMMDKKHISREVSAMTMKMLRPAGMLTPLIEDWAPDLFREWASEYYDVLTTT